MQVARIDYGASCKRNAVGYRQLDRSEHLVEFAFWQPKEGPLCFNVTDLAGSIKSSTTLCLASAEKVQRRNFL
ncbi:hypothetical protein KC321_g13 [Hortaea werneckii]|nr:hypothetical protein KC321_g13 [Hortaea werneckii]